mmetsp:Transcript_48474/g.78739  ORF Transcript_48474/g.78739 Transcript_48474/m.78739 type:complete len:283 (+) Transcript_48474:228-1076(+)
MDAHRVLVVLEGGRAVPSEDVILVGRELHELHAVMSETDFLCELRTGPKSNALLVEGRNVGSQRRPLDFPVAPNLLLRLLTLAAIAEDRLSCSGVMPVDLSFRLVAQKNLLPALLVGQPLAEIHAGEGAKSLLGRKFLPPGRDLVELVELHHFERVHSVEGHAIQGVLRCFCVCEQFEGGDDAALSGGAFWVHWHELVVGSVLVDELVQHVHQLVILLLSHLREAHDDDGVGKAGVQLDWRLDGVQLLAFAFRDEVQELLWEILFLNLGLDQIVDRHSLRTD